MTKVTMKEFKQLFNKGISWKTRHPQLVCQHKHFKRVRNYLRNYAEKHGFYFVELDEFTYRHIEELASVYSKMSENNWCIFYICLPNIIDYTTPHQEEALQKLAELIVEKKYNMQIVIDVHCVDSDTLQDIHEPCTSMELTTILHAPLLPMVDICRSSYVWDMK